MALIDRKQVARTARLAALGLTDEEIDQYTVRLARILEYFETLESLEPAGSETLVHPVGIEGPLRVDMVGPSLAVDALLANTDFGERGFFTVKKVIE